SHLQYFPRPTIPRFLQRRGFEVVAIRSTSVYRSIRGVLSGLILFERGMKRRAAWLADKALPMWVQERLGFWLDIGDIMLVCARKPESWGRRGVSGTEGSVKGAPGVGTGSWGVERRRP